MLQVIINFVHLLRSEVISGKKVVDLRRVKGILF